MPKFACRCGYVINLSNGFSDCELALIPEHRIEYIGEQLESPNQVNIDNFFELIDEVKIAVYKCPSCSRLYLDAEGNGTFTAFIPEQTVEE